MRRARPSCRRSPPTAPNAYNTTGGGAGLVANFKNAFGDSFDPAICEVDHVLEEGEIELAGIRFVVKPNAEAFDLEIPEINCVYTHMMGHDCHSSLGL